MKRILLLATTALVMAAMILAMATPVFAQPAFFTVVCFSENTGEGIVVFTDQGRIFGEGNRLVASLGFHGQECQREIIR